MVDIVDKDIGYCKRYTEVAIPKLRLRLRNTDMARTRIRNRIKDKWSNLEAMVIIEAPWGEIAISLRERTRQLGDFFHTR
jgi:hypothetical protein